MLVTAVGENSRWGRTRAKLTAEVGETPLQQKLNILAGQIGLLGMGTAAATFLALVVIWFSHPEHRPEHVTLVEYLLKAFIMAVTIVVVAVPEGLPLAVTLSLAYSTQKMMLDNNLIRVLAACETMGNATNICSDKTGTLTQNRMTVVEAWAGGRHFASAPPSASDVSAAYSKIIVEGVSVNSTAVLLKSSSGTIVSGSSTEGALLLMITNGFDADYTEVRSDNFNESYGDKLFTFTSARKCMSALVMNSKRSTSGRVYTKGASEALLAKCASYLNLQGKEVPLTAAVRKDVAKTIQLMASNALRTVALVHRDVSRVTGRENAFEIESGDFVLDMIVGIKDPLRPEVVDAVRTCQAAGIMVRMVTGDNIDTAKAIARECGILTEGGIAMEGPEFRKLTPAQVDAVLPTLQVLARSSPTDKHTLVTRLNGRNLPSTKEEWEEAHPDESWAKSRDRLLPGYAEEWHRSRQYGEVVGVTGDGTNDGPALKAADVGLSMGLSGTDGKLLCMFV